MVTSINVSKLMEQLELIAAGSFNGILASIREEESEALAELHKLQNGEEYDSDKLYGLVYRLANKQTVYKGLMLGYTALNAYSGNVGKGRRLGRSSADIALYKAIFRNEQKVPRAVTRFCEEHNITREKYSRIVNLRIKNDADREFLAEIKNEVI